jgi:competence ComEA-like helix-hairpin-helix protein
MMIPRSHLFLDNQPLSTTLLSLTLILSLSACAERARRSPSTTQTQANDQQSAATKQSTPARININTATANELETLPGIGKGLAARIIEHREQHGPFRRPEHLIIVRGISDKRFRGLRELITVE